MMNITMGDGVQVRLEGYKNEVAPEVIKKQLEEGYFPVVKKVAKYVKKKRKSSNELILLTPEDFYQYGRKKRFKLLISKDVYDSFQIFNMLSIPGDEAEVRDNWRLFSEIGTRFHNIGMKGFINRKYTTKDAYGGYLEVIFNQKGELVFDGINDATYNLYDAGTWGHKYDVVLWILHGVGGQNELTLCERIRVLRIKPKDIKALYYFLINNK